MLISHKRIQPGVRGWRLDAWSVKYFLAVLCLCSGGFAPWSQAAGRLPSIGIDIKRTSVSGLSSGAFMTSQFYIAHSDIMEGAGIVAGGPYLCAQSWSFQPPIFSATTTCMNPLTSSTGPNTPLLVKKAKKLAKENRIDDLDNLKNDRIYIFSGKADHVVTTLVVDQTEAFFESLGVPRSSILYNTNVDAGHALITNNRKDTACDLTKSPFINDCDFEQSHTMLRHIYPHLNPPASKPRGKIYKFDQTEFINSDYTSMSKDGYVYIPESCHGTSCSLHVAFHGCEQGAEVIGDLYFNRTGYNEIADTNKMVVLYPQVEPKKSLPFNPQGCWDFWGYSSPSNTNPDYYTKNAPQIRAVRAMIDRLAVKQSTKQARLR